jgi:hypothetical protein
MRMTLLRDRNFDLGRLSMRRDHRPRARHTPGRGAPPRRGPPRAGARHAPHAPPPPLRRSPECGPDAPPPRGDLRRGRLSHRRDGWAPAGIAPPTVTAVPTALEAHERGGSPSAARQSVRARSVIASYTQPTQIEIPIPLGMVSTTWRCGTGASSVVSSHCVQIATRLA